METVVACVVVVEPLELSTVLLTVDGTLLVDATVDVDPGVLLPVVVPWLETVELELTVVPAEVAVDAKVISFSVGGREPTGWNTGTAGGC